MKRYGGLLPILGFNSGRYDLGCLSAYFPKIFGLLSGTPLPSHEDNDIPVSQEENRHTYLLKKDLCTFKPSIIGQTNNYKQIITKDGLKFLDLMNYVPAQTSLDKLVKNYQGIGVTQHKAKFPYAILSEPNFDEIQLLDAKGKLMNTSQLYNNGSEPCYFDDNFRQECHRSKSNLLEFEWSSFMRGQLAESTKSVINHMANDLAIMEEKAKREEEEKENHPETPATSDASFIDETPVTSDASFNGETAATSDASLNDETPATSDASFNDETPATCDASLKVEWMELLGCASQTHQVARTMDAEDLLMMPGVKRVCTGLETFDKEVKKVIEGKKLHTVKEYLEYYNGVDVEVMMPVIDAMTDNFRHLDPAIELGREDVSLPNIARILCHKSAAEHGGIFYLPKGEIEGQLEERAWRRNLYGGPSIIFNRFAQAHRTKTEGGCTVKKIITQDANALYSKAMQLNMPVGHSVHYYGPDDHSLEDPISDEWVYRELGKSKESLPQLQWVEGTQQKVLDLSMAEEAAYNLSGMEGTYPDPTFLSIIHTKATTSQTVRVGSYLPDGIRHRPQFTDLELRTVPEWAHSIVYEFMGSFYHGSPTLIKKRYDEGKDVNFLIKRFRHTQRKLKDLIKAGCVIFLIWEDEFRACHTTESFQALHKSLPDFTREYATCRNSRSQTKEEARQSLLRTLQDPHQFQNYLMEEFDPEKVLRAEEQDINFFGLAEVDLAPKEGSDFSKFGPIFASGYLENGEKASLSGVQRVKKFIVFTPYLQCLCSIGIKITRVWRVWEFKKAHCFKPFVDQAVEERKKGDLPNGNSLLSEVYKLVVNSSYGGMIQNKDKHSQISFYTNDWDVCKQVNLPTFKDATAYSSGVKEVASVKNKINQNVPIQIGKAVLDYGKLWMVYFKFHIIQKHLCEDKIDLMSLDTDSFTMAIGADSLDDLVLPHCQDTWESVIRPNWFVHKGCQGKRCQDPECNKRPGPFKLEYEGEKNIGLSSKLYTVTRSEPGVPPKVACKGLTKSSLFYDDSIRFQNTLNGTGEKLTVTMSSFQRKKDHMLTVRSQRTVSNKYLKRQLCPDDDTRTRTWQYEVDCSTPPKLQKLWEERRGILKIQKSGSSPANTSVTSPVPVPSTSQHPAPTPSTPLHPVPGPSTSAHPSDPIAERIAANKARAIALLQQNLNPL